MRVPVLGSVATAAFAFLWSRGRIHVDLGWGRSLQPLGPMTVRIQAPRDLVFDAVAGPYLGRTPAALKKKLTVIAREGNLAVASHRTKLPLMDALTVEIVQFERPARVSFSLLRGPVPHVEEEFLLEQPEPEITLLTYRGELGTDLWMIGQVYGKKLVRPVWEAAVASSIEQIKAASEKRAAANRDRS
ncbi:MAG: SRPBCC family protein [Actinomycetota bacterium]